MSMTINPPGAEEKWLLLLLTSFSLWPSCYFLSLMLLVSHIKAGRNTRHIKEKDINTNKIETVNMLVN